MRCLIVAIAMHAANNSNGIAKRCQDDDGLGYVCSVGDVMIDGK